MKGSPMELDFGSENTAPVNPVFEAAIRDANHGFATNFEDDRWSTKAKSDLEDFFEFKGLDVYIVSTGTAANALALGAMVPPYGNILCHWDSHIETDECGAPAMFTFGARQIALSGEHGKISVNSLKEHLQTARIGVVHSLQPWALSLTNLTEAGTAYNPEEISSLCSVAKNYGLGVHLDGARFANALVATGATPAEMTWKSGVQVVVLGTTKLGSYGAEVVVSFDPAYRKELAYLRKRSGHFAPKSRFLSAQVSAYIANDYWRKSASQANSMAKRLASGLTEIPGIELIHPVDGNEVFVQFDSKTEEAIVVAGCKFQRLWRHEPRHSRFVCSWATTEGQVDKLISVCRSVA